MLTRCFSRRSLPLLKAVPPPRHRETNTFATADPTLFFAAAECTLDDFYIFDGIPDSSGAIVDFRFSYINPNAESRLGVPRETLYGKVLTEVRPYMIQSGLIHKYREVVRTGIPYTGEVFIDDEMIKGTWLNVQVVRLGNGIAITSRDVTEHRRRSDHVNYLAHHDHLTGLANRTLLHERLRQAILRAQDHGQRVAVFLIDIDYFKQINDSLGHADGDILLATMGQRLLSSVRESDTVARMGGDEFVIVMPEFHTIRDVERCGEQIIRNASEPVEISGRKIIMTLSVGITIFPENGRTAEELLRNADAAMYTVKDSGRNSLCVFDETLMTR
jgi:diguanylate cyclase (GGDEF)-like protein